MFTQIANRRRELQADRNRRRLINGEPQSTLSAAFNALFPSSDLQRWRKWADNCPPHLRTLPADIPDDVPYRGLKNYWYPVMSSKELGTNQMVPRRLLGQDLVFFRGTNGAPRALSDTCPHRQAKLSLGWINLYAPDTITCPYHGWTFDGKGQCVAALAEGPNSPLPKNVRTTTYPAEERHHLIWVYMGQADQIPDIDDNLPHVKEAMDGSWPWFIHWDWPVNYLNALDNDADVVHPNLAHARCSQFIDQSRWNKAFATNMACGGLHVGITGEGPPHTGPRSSTSWDMHVPGYIYFAPSPPKWPAGAIFWAVPVDEGNMRMLTFTTFKGSWMTRIRCLGLQTLYWRSWGLPNNIYHCNKGADRAIVLSQGRLADWRLERRSQTDLPVVKFRMMMRQALLAEKKKREQLAESKIEASAG